MLSEYIAASIIQAAGGIGLNANKILLYAEQYDDSSLKFYESLKENITAKFDGLSEISSKNLASSLDACPKGTILILPNAVRFPAKAKGNLTEFLSRGNHLIAVSGPALTEMLDTETDDDKIPPIVESISPGYKTYPVNQAAFHIADVEYTADVISPVLRMQGKGSDSVRKWRFIPLINITGKAGTDYPVRGTVAHLFVNNTGPNAGSVYGYLGLGQSFLNANPDVSSGVIIDMIERIKQGIFIANAGTEHFAYEVGENVDAGAWLINTAGTDVDGRLRFSILKDGVEVFGQEIDAGLITSGLSVNPVRTGAISLPEGEYLVRTQLFAGDDEVDNIEHHFQILSYPELTADDVVRLEGKDFYLGDDKWYPHGMNFWPLYVSGSEDPKDALHWFQPGNYDPEAIEEELILAEELKMNILSIAVYDDTQARPLMDFMARASKHGQQIHLNIGCIKPAGSDFDAARRLMEASRLHNSPAMFSYDLGWEVHLGYYDDRKVFDSIWQDWVIDRYGSIESAETDWQYKPQRVDGVITGPFDDQLTTDGEWRIFVAAYRRFWDDEISRRYKEIREFIRSIDKHHLMGARSGWAGTGSMWAVPGFPYDLLSGVKHLDYTSPESYNIYGFWVNDKLGLLHGGINTAYGRSVSGGKPVVWIEYSPETAFALDPYTWTGYTDELLDIQKRYYHDHMVMVREKGGNGHAGWWWCGGFRMGENSDLGIINPDLTPRPAAIVFKDMVDYFTEERTIPDPDVYITFDRDEYVTGYAGLFEKYSAECAALMAEGHTVGFKTPGTGTTSVDTPLIAVGNVPCTGSNPPKYLNAEFNWIKINGINVNDGSEIEVDCGKPLCIEVSAGNIGEAEWVASNETVAGTVFLAVRSGDIIKYIPIDGNVPYLGDADIKGSFVYDWIEDAVEVELNMTSINRTKFGEVIRIIIRQAPEDICVVDV
ncbi:MAG: hypothetical protein ACYC27_19110 [Armatimonadota bacterium]